MMAPGLPDIAVSAPRNRFKEMLTNNILSAPLWNPELNRHRIDIEHIPLVFCACAVDHRSPE